MAARHDTVTEMLALRSALVLAMLAASCSSASSQPKTAGGADGSVPDTWATYAHGFFDTYCTECHNAIDTTGRDYSVIAKVESDKLLIRCGVAVAQDPSWNCASSPVAKQFPIGNGPKPQDSERTRIVDWISSGAP